MSLSVHDLKPNPPAVTAAAKALLQAERAGALPKLVVLDDDPTGTQTMHDISVYTRWDAESLDEAFREETPLFYILTNSRSLAARESESLHRELAAAVEAAAGRAGRDYVFYSRSDSTLRGHYPLETEVLREEYERPGKRKVDGEILCFFFPEGGRYTIDNVHYLRYGEELRPVNETEFARDKTFGYSASSLPAYVEEKTGGRFRAKEVCCLSLKELRSGKLKALERKLTEVKNFGKIVVNAVDYTDLTVFCVALFRAVKKGKRFLFRGAASLVKVLGGISQRELLSKEEIKPAVKADGQEPGGLILIGSHTEKTSRQLEALGSVPGINFIELDASLVREEEAWEQEISRCLAAEEEALRAGRTVCCYTSRQLLTADTGEKEDDLRLSMRISAGVEALAGRLKTVPAYIIAKGGITSSRVATEALGIKKARVLGQILPGVPVWRAGEESRFPGIPYIVFPGNVGEDESLKQAVEILSDTGDGSL